jgi:hypothetical protein
MRPELPRVWLRVTLRRVPGGVRAQVESSSERARSTPAPVFDGRWYGSELGLEDALERLPIDAVVSELDRLELVVRGSEPTTPAFREGGRQPATIPLFLRVNAAGDAWPFESALTARLAFAKRTFGITVVLETTRHAPEPARLTLPASVFLGSIAPDAMRQDLAEMTHWLREDLALTEIVTDRRQGRTSDVPFDIAVVDSTMPRVPRRLSTRLLVIVAPSPGAITAPDGARSVCYVPTLTQAGMFLENLTHDLPLHDAFAQMVSDSRPRDVCHLVSSPQALHDLRLTDLVTEMSYLQHDLESGGAMPDFAEQATYYRLDRAYGHHRLDRLPGTYRTVWQHAATKDPGKDVYFDHESEGLLPIWQRLRNLRVLAVARSPDFRSLEVVDDTIAAQRVVDVTLRRHPSVPGRAAGTFVRPGTTLQAGGRYDLRVRIGQATADTIMVGARQAIDLLLPPSDDGHALEIVCFEGDFALEGHRSVTTFLRPVGPSDVVEFSLRAPLEPGRVTARLGVYYRRNLLQSFLFSAKVGAREARTRRHEGPRAELDHSMTYDWRDLDAFGPRSLSLVVNSSGTSHRLYLNGDDEPEEWALNPEVQKQLASGGRSVLAKAISKKQRKPGQAPEASLTDLARAGSELHLALFTKRRQRPSAAAGQPAAPGRSPSAMQAIVEAWDSVIQVVRVDTNQAIPWQLLYDWDVPADEHSTWPECYGVDRSGKSCGHRFDSGVVCVNGFWGVRHCIEEYIGARPDTALSIPVPSGKLRVDLALGITNDYVEHLVEQLDKVVDVRRLLQADSLLDRLWDATARSPVCAVVGHCEEQKLVTGTSEKLLTWQLVAKHALRRNNLTDPRPLLFLLACETGAVDPSMVANNVEAFTSAGVAAILATECIVWTSQVETFGAAFFRSFIASLDAPPEQSPVPFASAIREARVAMTRAGSLAGLAFIAFGPASVRLVSSPAPPQAQRTLAAVRA